MRSVRLRISTVAVAMAVGVCFLLSQRSQTGPPVVLHNLANTNGSMQISGSHYGSYFILPDGSLWYWGSVTRSVLPHSEAPQRLFPDRTWLSVHSVGGEAVVAVREDGTLWRWGKIPLREQDEVGRTYYYSAEPVQIGSATNWKSARISQPYGLAQARDGTLWAWEAALTWNSRISGESREQARARFEPVLIDTNREWSDFMILPKHIAGLRRDGSLFIRDRAVWSTDAQWRMLGDEGSWNEIQKSAQVQSKAGELWFLSVDAVQAGSGAPIGKDAILLATNTAPRRVVANGGLEPWSLTTIGPEGGLWKTRVGVNGAETEKRRRVGSRSDWVQLWGGSTMVGLTADGTLWAWGVDASIPRDKPREAMLDKFRRWLRLPGRPPSEQANIIKEPVPILKMTGTGSLLKEPDASTSTD